MMPPPGSADTHDGTDLQQNAAQGFKSLSDAHAQRDPTLSHRRVCFTACFVALLAALLSVFAIDWQETGHTRSYASSLRRLYHLSDHCDASLGVRRFFGLGAVVTGSSSSSGLCADHGSAPTAPAAAFSFLVVGDWGRDGLCCQRDVATEMAAVANATHPAFIASTGDNFYEKGIVSHDDPQVTSSWRDVYSSLGDVPWNVVLGNHDHEGSVNAQLDLSEKDNIWHYPAPYYFQTFESSRVFVAYLDTTCLYYDDLSMFPALASNASLRTHCTKQQLADLDTELSGLRPEKVRHIIVIGHHPFYSSSSDAEGEKELQSKFRDRLVPILKKYKVTAYVCGHEHLLEHFDLGDGLHSFVSGAGSKIRTVSLAQPTSVFSLDRQGFLQVALPEKDSEHLVFKFYDYTGAVVHSTALPQRTV